MSLYLRAQGYYHYKFTIGGKQYSGNTNTTVKREAKAFEDKLKADIKSSIRLGVKLKRTANPHVKETIPLGDVWGVFQEEAPAKMTRQPSEKKWKYKQSCWSDFICYLKAKHPKVKTLKDLNEDCVVKYVNHLKEKGRFNKYVASGSDTKKGYTAELVKLAPSTINEYITQLKQIIDILLSKSGLVSNPFAKVSKCQNRKVKREVFTKDEITSMYSFINQTLPIEEYTSNDAQLDQLINRALVIIGLNTGLDRQSIALLKWEYIDKEYAVITMTRGKTGEKLSIPISRELRVYLRSLHHINQFVCPQLAEMYIQNSNGVSLRFKKMLKHLGIKGNSSVTGRTREVSVKDIHSLRHTFCYNHGIKGTPIRVIQSMTGHMSKGMTESYTLHETEESKRLAIDSISNEYVYSSMTKDELVQVIKDMNSDTWSNLKDKVLAKR